MRVYGDYVGGYVCYVGGGGRWWWWRWCIVNHPSIARTAVLDVVISPLFARVPAAAPPSGIEPLAGVGWVLWLTGAARGYGDVASITVRISSCHLEHGMEKQTTGRSRDKYFDDPFFLKVYLHDKFPAFMKAASINLSL